MEFGPIPTFYTDLRPCILQSSSATACLISRANSEFSCLYGPNSITSICCGFVELLCLRTRNNPHSRLAVAARVKKVRHKRPGDKRCADTVFQYPYLIRIRGSTMRLSVFVGLSQVGVLLKRLNESSWFLACELPSTRPTLIGGSRIFLERGDFENPSERSEH